jgi:hypothetical protein
VTDAVTHLTPAHERWAKRLAHEIANCLREELGPDSWQREIVRIDREIERLRKDLRAAQEAYTHHVYGSDAS